MTSETILTGLIAIFTGFTGWVSWKLYKDQREQRLPAVFVRLLSFENGALIKVTVRNRADHPMRVETIEVLNASQIGLIDYRGESSGSENGKRYTQVWGYDESAERQKVMDMTLTSANRNSDSGSRKYILYAKNPPPRIKIRINCDPSDGTERKISLIRSLNFSSEEKIAIGRYKP